MLLFIIVTWDGVRVACRRHYKFAHDLPPRMNAGATSSWNYRCASRLNLMALCHQLLGLYRQPTHRDFTTFAYALQTITRLI